MNLVPVSAEKKMKGVDQQHQNESEVCAMYEIAKTCLSKDRDVRIFCRAYSMDIEDPQLIESLITNIYEDSVVRRGNNRRRCGNEKARGTTVAKYEHIGVDADSALSSLQQGLSVLSRSVKMVKEDPLVRRLVIKLLKLAVNLQKWVANQVGGISAVILSAGMDGDIIPNVITACVDSALYGTSAVINAKSVFNNITGIEYDKVHIPFSGVNSIDDLVVKYRNMWQCNMERMENIRSKIVLSIRDVQGIMTDAISFISTWISVLIPDDAGTVGNVTQIVATGFDFAAELMTDNAIISVLAGGYRIITEIFKRIPQILTSYLETPEKMRGLVIGTLDLAEDLFANNKAVRALVWPLKKIANIDQLFDYCRKVASESIDLLFSIISLYLSLSEMCHVLANPNFDRTNLTCPIIIINSTTSNTQ